MDLRAEVPRIPALLSVGGQRPEFISRNANPLARFGKLALVIDRELAAAGVLDGEIVCFDREGRPRFYDLMFRRGDPAFVAFDVLALEGQDLRERSLAKRKKISRSLIPRRSPFVLYADHIEARGCDFFRLVCARDLEGIVAKWKAAPYQPQARLSSWLQIKNRDYSQARERAELFQR
jgi:bifunctional non-homologous end joining protein LigD